MVYPDLLDLQGSTTAQIFASSFLCNLRFFLLYVARVLRAEYRFPFSMFISSEHGMLIGGGS